MSEETKNSMQIPDIERTVSSHSRSRAVATSSVSLESFERNHRKTRSDGYTYHPVAGTADSNSELDLRRSRSAADRASGNHGESRPLTKSPISEFSRPKDISLLHNEGFRSAFNSSELLHRLVVSLRKDQSSQRQFIPKPALDEIVTQATVNHELSKFEYITTKIKYRTWRRGTFVRVEPHACPKASIVSRPILDNAASEGQVKVYKQIFTILMLIRCSKKIWSFVKEGVCDSYLPLEKHEDKSGRIILRGSNGTQDFLKCLKKPSDIIDFVERQWSVLVPVIGADLEDKKVSHYLAGPEEALPFKEWTRCDRAGGSGKIHRAVLYPGHHFFDPGLAPKGLVAVKRLSADFSEIYDREVRVLRNLQKARHIDCHIVPLLATYTRLEKFYLILPWAEADLSEYWTTIFPNPSSQDPLLREWVLTQCCGLAQAASTIHRYKTFSGSSMIPESPTSVMTPKDFTNNTQSQPSISRRNSQILFGRHGDIKPENILWFPGPGFAISDGVLKLSDFGNACFARDETLSRRDRDSVEHHGTYESPESQIPGGELSGQCDIWALGCVFLEFVCWLFGGAAALKDFAHQRKESDAIDRFFILIPPGPAQLTSAVLKKTVSEKLKSLQADKRCAVNLSKFLTTIEEGMLIVNNGILSPLHETNEADDIPSAHHLRVQNHQWRRRKSAGNVALELGSLIVHKPPSLEGG